MQRQLARTRADESRAGAATFESQAVPQTMVAWSRSPGHLRRRLHCRALVLLSLCSAILFEARCVSGFEYEAPITADCTGYFHLIDRDCAITSGPVIGLLDAASAGIDLDTATRDTLYELPGLTYYDVDRILAYRARNGRIGAPAELVEAGVISTEQLTALAPFLVPTSKQPEARVHGRLRLRLRALATDRVLPPLVAEARVQRSHALAAGVSLLSTRLRVHRVRYDPLFDGLVARPPHYELHLAKAFVRWDTQHTSLIVGSFRAGFGERLTLDNTRRRAPHGLYADTTTLESSDSALFCRYSSSGGAEPVCAERGLSSYYTTADPVFEESFRGVALSVERWGVGNGVELSLHGFASYEPRSVYQYEIYDRSACRDPRSGDAACDAPALYSPDGTRRYAYMTLPNVFDELLVGGHIDAELARSLGFGLTAYSARPFWRVRGVNLDFQEWSANPRGGSFGAAGVDARVAIGELAVTAEVTRSFDRTPTRGGFGAVARVVQSSEHREIELSLRSYGKDFANPYARPIAAADELDGSRARNEAGVRYRHVERRAERWRLLASADWWWTRREHARAVHHLALKLRGDLRLRRELAIFAWIDHVNKDLADNGVDRCYDTASESGADPEPDEATASACSGELYRISARISIEPLGPWLRAAWQYAHAFVSDPHYRSRYRQDRTVSGELAAEARGWLAFRLHARYVDRALDDAGYLERSLLTAFDVRVGATASPVAVRARYAAAMFLDHRTSTLARVPNPEHQLALDVEGRF